MSFLLLDRLLVVAALMSMSAIGFILLDGQLVKNKDVKT